jgi:hypothetical protein
MLSFNEVLNMALPEVYLVDDGYTGNKALVKLALVDNTIYEVSKDGYYRAPVSKAADITELHWLIKNHPSMRVRYL